LSKITAPLFDGTVMPIAYIPDWTKTANQDKSKRFEDIPISEYLPIPLYDALALRDEKNTSKGTTILRYTYITTYMGTYKLDYHEYEGGHLGVDIRAPIGTPVLSIANGVVVRVVEADSTGNRFIVVRHDGIMVDGKSTSLYSGYLHLSEALTKEGDIVRKGDMIGRVGISGITTTPHLHIQIDIAEAPFHPYWHFTGSEAKSQ
jgi:murein DD-endopeptidase MepM/ murein hydrolase activator NlpD